MMHLFIDIHGQSHICTGRVVLSTLCGSTSEDIKAVLSGNLENTRILIAIDVKFSYLFAQRLYS